LRSHHCRREKSGLGQRRTKKGGEGKGRGPKKLESRWWRVRAGQCAKYQGDEGRNCEPTENQIPYSAGEWGGTGYRAYPESRRKGYFENKSCKISGVVAFISTIMNAEGSPAWEKRMGQKGSPVRGGADEKVYRGRENITQGRRMAP